ncbi:NADH dehydrogenase FAD-containing subunit [Streptosporangium album]|uniref:NADH dehydrogenase FAD-containing subunit n=1 Tax=Streptosporangium album TaxID=47479 RepID=A0A7W7RVB8_9ACTN|nr:FAD-dependent oxidoreductase [Streptosporangium album]MBB4938855.1 NADH dehydrogenase FAD-containing subunit [Streptosporangium album]
MAHHMVVLGAGYAGLLAAKLAAKRTGARITLVNAGDRFVERVRLHQLAAGQRLRDLPLKDSLRGTGIELVVDRVTGIDTADRTVRLARTPQAVGYDTLVYALGSRADLDSVPGAAEHAYGVALAEQASRLRDRVREGGTVTVAGGGLTGIEAATELAETYPELKVGLVTDGMLGGALSERARRYLRRTFGRLGIEVRENARVTEVRADGLVLEGGEHVGADTVVWTTGFRVPDLAREAGIAVDGHGRMVVDETLRSVSHPEIYGVGDAAAVRRPGGQEPRMACATGLPSAQQAVHAIAARMAGREPRPLRFRYVNQCISLGRRDGLIQFVHADDSPREAVLTGRPAALYKESIVRGTILSQRYPALPTSF